MRECADQTVFEDWVAGTALGIPGLTFKTAAEHYPEIFERRFRGDREAGYAELEGAMEGKTPSFGYSLLAEIIQHTRHKVVVTTNFDNLVADALAMHAHQSPLVVAHESLAGFVRPQLRRPLVAKIHRDLFFNPKNDHAGVSTMEEGWKIALRKLFQYFTPVVIGYGGNDGSLMGLLKSLDGGDIAGRVIWCYRDGALPNVAEEVLIKHQGLKVKIPGFDEFMLLLAAKLVKEFDVAALADRTARLGQERAERYKKQASDLRESLERGTTAQQKTGRVLSASVQAGKSWWSWAMQADAEPDLAKRTEIFEQGLRQFPNSVELIGSYANFLVDRRKDFDAAEAMFNRALELDPANAGNTGNFANFLANKRRSPEAAEALYKKALDLEPHKAANTGNYAIFLTNERRDFDAAEMMYKRALEIDPSSAKITTNYANFLKNHRKDFDSAEAMYKKALELDPNSAGTAGSYANFLANQRRDLSGARAMYEKALTLDPGNVINTVNYANFLGGQQKDFDAAEAMFKKALELDPSDAGVTGIYANFLSDQRKNFDAAEAIYKKALELDPANAVNTGNYANFLKNKRNDLVAAESMYKKALELDPGNAANTSNYATFLAGYPKDLDSAEAMYKKALELDPTIAATSGNYANFLANERGDLNAAAAMYRKALELDPINAINTGNYANLLKNQGKDFDAAEVMYKKALELDPGIAANTSNYATFLAGQRRDLDAAEVMYKKALDLDPADVNTSTNYMSLLLMRGDPESLRSLDDMYRNVLDGSKRAPSQALAEALLYVCLRNELVKLPPSSFLSELKWVIERGYERGPWDFGPIFDCVLPRIGAAQADFYRALGTAILDQSRVPWLKSFDPWNCLSSVDPFSD